LRVAARWHQWGNAWKRRIGKVRVTKVGAENMFPPGHTQSTEKKENEGERDSGKDRRGADIGDDSGSSEERGGGSKG